MSAGASSRRAWQFCHEAMATTFRFVVVGEDQAYAEDAANTAFRDIDLIESELSRFQPGSDITRLNAAGRGEEVYVGPAACDCLMLAQDVAKATEGAFDITIGPLFQLWRESGDDISESQLASARAKCGWRHLEISPYGPMAKKGVDGMLVDLGGIGKGYALDQSADLLRDWDIEHGLLSAGDSTVLAIGSAPGSNDGWPVNAGTPGSAPVQLSDGHALSGSGFEVQGEHIIDPRTGRPCPMTDTDRPIIWAVSPGAALSDALSTAFMILRPGEVEALCKQQRDVRAIYFSPEP